MRPTAGVIETVSGPIGERDVRGAHEHLFVDFLGPAEPDYGR